MNGSWLLALSSWLEPENAGLALGLKPSALGKEQEQILAHTGLQLPTYQITQLPNSSIRVHSRGFAALPLAAALMLADITAENVFIKKAALLPLSFSGHEVANKRQEARKPIIWVYIVFNHIKRKVIETAKTPDCQYQEQAYLKRRLIQKKEHRRHQAQGKKQDAFHLD